MGSRLAGDGENLHTRALRKRKRIAGRPAACLLSGCYFNKPVLPSLFAGLSGRFALPATETGSPYLASPESLDWSDARAREGSQSRLGLSYGRVQCGAGFGVGPSSRPRRLRQRSPHGPPALGLAGRVGLSSPSPLLPRRPDVQRQPSLLDPHPCPFPSTHRAETRMSAAAPVRSVHDALLFECAWEVANKGPSGRPSSLPPLLAALR
jgi:hypothetical protein